MPSRIEREVEELLARMDAAPPRRPPGRGVRRALSRPFRSLGALFAGLSLPHIPIGQVLLLAMVVIVIAYVIDGGGSAITRAVIIAGIVGFVVAFILSLRRQSAPPEKRWRGEPMELGGPRAGYRMRSWWDRLRGRR